MTMIIEMLRKHEGVETHAYVDTVGKVTIGVGRNIEPPPSPFEYRHRPAPPFESIKKPEKTW